MKILIADDDPSYCIILEQWVRPWGYDPISVTDGGQAWELFQGTEPPGLAIFDWIMPDINGIDLCRKLKSSRHPHPVYLILLTGKNSKEDLITALDAGADDFLSKPVQPDELRSRLAVGQRTLGYQQALACRNQQLRTLFAALPGPVLFKDEKGRWLEANQKALELFRLNDADYQGKTDAELAEIPGARKSVLLGCAEADHKAWTNPGLLYEEVEMAGDVTDEKKYLELIRAPLFRANGERKGIIMAGHDITLHKTLEDKLRREAHFDSLTNLLNRRYFQERLDQAVNYAKSFRHPLSLCLCDIDKFKEINDTHGHLAGDEVLVQFGHILRSELRTTDVGGRLGGDEFCLLFLGTGAKDALNCLNRIRHRLRSLHFAAQNGKNFNISVSFGMAELEPGMQSKDLLGAADEAVYEAKAKTGKNRVALYESPDAQEKAVPKPEVKRIRSRIGNPALEKKNIEPANDHDPVTGLLDYRHFRRHLSDAVTNAHIQHQSLTLCLTSIDDFDALVEAHGQRAAEEVLRRFSHIMRNDLRATDMLGRTPEGEFCIVFPGGGIHVCINSLNRVRGHLQESAFVNESSQIFVVAASFGMAELNNPRMDLKGLLALANQALALARQNGGGQVRVWNNEG